MAMPANDEDCGICLQPLARLLQPAPCGGLSSSLARRASLNNCRHVFCYECIAKWACISTSCPSCRTAFSEMSVLNVEGEVERSVVYQQPQQQRDDDEDVSELFVSSDVGSNEDEREYLEFLDQFVVPDGVVEIENNTAVIRGSDHSQDLSPPDARTRRGRSRRVSSRSLRTDVEAQDEALARSRRSFLDRLAAQRRAQQERARNRPWFRDALPSDEEVLPSDSDSHVHQDRRRRRRSPVDLEASSRATRRRRRLREARMPASTQQLHETQANVSERLETQGRRGSGCEEEEVMDLDAFAYSSTPQRSTSKEARSCRGQDTSNGLGPCEGSSLDAGTTSSMRSTGLLLSWPDASSHHRTAHAHLPLVLKAWPSRAARGGAGAGGGRGGEWSGDTHGADVQRSGPDAHALACTSSLLSELSTELPTPFFLTPPTLVQAAREDWAQGCSNETEIATQLTYHDSHESGSQDLTACVTLPAAGAFARTDGTGRSAACVASGGKAPCETDKREACTASATSGVPVYILRRSKCFE